MFWDYEKIIKILKKRRKLLKDCGILKQIYTKF